MTTLATLVQAHARTRPDATIYRFLSETQAAESTRTYAQLDLAARRIAALLQSMDMRGERALLCFEPGPAFIEAFLGCVYAGCIAVPAYPPSERANITRLDAIAADCTPRIALYQDGARFEWSQVRASKALSEVQFVACTELPSGYEAMFASSCEHADDVCFLQYTSGSTGNPKGVEITHRNIRHNLAITQAAFSLSERDRGLFWLPPYHDMGLIGALLQPLHVGMTAWIAPPAWFVRDPLRWLEAISRLRITVSGGPNFAYDLCVRSAAKADLASLDLRSWSLAFVGAEPVRSETLERFARCFEHQGFSRSSFYPCYGLAENTLLATGGTRGDSFAVSRLCREHPGESLRASVSCGDAVGGQQVLIVDPATRHPVAAGSWGEVWIHGESVARGYWRRERLTRERFQAQLADTLGGSVPRGPYLRTGDRGCLQDGQLHLAGRMNDVIIVRGRNYCAEDIEQVARCAHPLLSGQVSAAFEVEVEHGTQVALVHEFAGAAADEVAAHVEQALLRELGLKVDRVVLVGKGMLPRTTSGKVMRFAARSAFQRGAFTARAACSRDAALAT